jgi:hypothetical protein
VRYVELLADCFASKARGKDDEAEKKLDRIADEMGKHELEIEMYYDHCLMVNAHRVIFMKNVTHNEYMDVEA